LDGKYAYIGSGKTNRIQHNINCVKRGEHKNPTLQQAYYDSETKDLRPELPVFNIENPREARKVEQEYIDFLEKVEGVIVCNSREANNGCISENYNKHPRLTKEKVKEIKELIDSCTTKELCDTYNCSAKVISDIRRGARWQNV
jgi:hypothetical protein